jgi:hypothetical protein
MTERPVTSQFLTSLVMDGRTFPVSSGMGCASPCRTLEPRNPDNRNRPQLTDRLRHGQGVYAGFPNEFR